MAQLFQTKPLDRLLHEQSYSGQLKRELGVVDLVALGVGAIVGAGIFATVGTAAAGSEGHVGAGPALIVSFVLTAVACAFSALCYAEFAAMIPISGSAYTYAYTTLGELAAWIIGWDLILEYAIGNVAVAVSWSGYFNQVLKGFGLEIPRWLMSDYRTAMKTQEIVGGAPRVFDIPVVINLPALLIVVAITWILVIGVKESARFNSAMVALKVVILLFFIGLGFFYVKPEHWTPFAPNGWQGVATGAALIFFAYIGFDAISTTAEECRNPQRDMPIGMIASLLICTVLYILTAVVLTGMVPWNQLNVPEPMALAFERVGLPWIAFVVSLGAVIAMTAVLLVFQMGQPRIFFAMARDGLLPRAFAKVHPRYRTPHVTTIWTGVFVAFFASFVDIGEAVELTNIGTLFALMLVCAGIIVLRYVDPERRRPFRCPAVPLVPVLGMLSCGYLMLQLPRITWLRFGIWLAIGLAIYFLYGFSNSQLRRATTTEPHA